MVWQSFILTSVLMVHHPFYLKCKKQLNLLKPLCLCQTKWVTLEVCTLERIFFLLNKTGTWLWRIMQNCCFGKGRLPENENDYFILLKVFLCVNKVVVLSLWWFRVVMAQELVFHLPCECPKLKAWWVPFIAQMSSGASSFTSKLPAARSWLSMCTFILALPS